MVYKKLVRDVVSELKNKFGDHFYGDGNLNRIKRFLEEKEVEFKLIPVSELPPIGPENERDMLNMGIIEIEKYLLHKDPVYVKYAYLNLVEAYILMKREEK